MTVKIKVKRGMAGSRCGKGRRDSTEFLKKMSKKLRRREGRQSCKS